MNKKLGVVFSADAVVGVIVLSLFAISFAFLSSKAQDNSYSQLLLKKQAGDLLIALDKSGDLAANASELYSSINKTLLSGTYWNLTRQFYNYSGGFVLNPPDSVASSGGGGKSEVSSQREFLVLANGTVKYYGIAKLRLWTD